MLRKRWAEPAPVDPCWTGAVEEPFEEGTGTRQLASEVATDAGIVARWTSLAGRDDLDAVRTVTWLGGAEVRMRWRRASDGLGETAASNDVESSYWRHNDDDDDAVTMVTPDATGDSASLNGCCWSSTTVAVATAVPIAGILQNLDLQQHSRQVNPTGRTKIEMSQATKELLQNTRPIEVTHPQDVLT